VCPKSQVKAKGKLRKGRNARSKERDLRPLGATQENNLGKADWAEDLSSGKPHAITAAWKLRGEG